MSAPAPRSTGSTPARTAQHVVVIARLDGRDPGEVDPALAGGIAGILVELDGVTPVRIFRQSEPPIVGCCTVAGLVVHGLGCHLVAPARVPLLLPPVWP